MLGAAPLVAADFDDDVYHEFILNDLDSADIDVLILPAVAPDSDARIAAVQQSIAAWESGIQAYAPSWLADNVDFHVYLVGTDPVPLSTLQDPEIVVVTGEANPNVLFGIGASTDYLACDTVDPFTSTSLFLQGFHHHPGSAWSVGEANCADNSDNVCVVLNTNFAFYETGQYSMYDLNAHEFGHCLGLGHVGDALDFVATTFPHEDIMSYQENEAQVHCVSNLNVLGLQGTFAKVLGRPSSEWRDSGDYITMTPAAYDQVSCPNPAQVS